MKKKSSHVRSFLVMVGCAGTLLSANADSASKDAHGAGPTPIQIKSPWSAVIVYGGQSPWTVQQVVAEVRRSGDVYKIEIFTAVPVESDRRPMEILTGSIVSGKAQFKRKILNSDVAEEGVAGSFTSHAFGGKRHEVFALSNPYSLIGINRIINDDPLTSGN